jgi:excisionase family DNA binding protein
MPDSPVTHVELAAKLAEIVDRIRELEETVEDYRNLETYTRAEAAKLLKVSVDTIDRWIAANRIRALKPTGGRTLIRKTVLRRFLNTLEQELYQQNKENLK